jgi:septal ring factor EnvC (AmiA/AmiB activator)
VILRGERVKTITSPSPKEIAAALDGQSKKIKALKAKNQALEDEVRPLRATTKLLPEATEKLKAAQQAAEFMKKGRTIRPSSPRETARPHC